MYKEFWIVMFPNVIWFSHICKTFGYIKFQWSEKQLVKSDGSIFVF